MMSSNFNTNIRDYFIVFSNNFEDGSIDVDISGYRNSYQEAAEYTAMFGKLKPGKEIDVWVTLCNEDLAARYKVSIDEYENISARYIRESAAQWHMFHFKNATGARNSIYKIT